MSLQTYYVYYLANLVQNHRLKLPKSGRIALSDRLLGYSKSSVKSVTSLKREYCIYQR
jgi:hypothetical protein